MNTTTFSPFYVKDCTLAAIATGIKAQTLLELKDKITLIHPTSIYFHFWGGRLRIAYEHQEYHNDFANWVHRNLQDDVLAERLEILNPTEYESIEELRSEIIDILENRLDERESIAWSKSDQKFNFIESKIVVFQTRLFLEEPKELIKVIPHIPKSSLFYHFIDAARRLPNKENDFSNWLSIQPEIYGPLIEELDKIDPYLISLSDLRHRFLGIVTNFFEKKSR